MDEATARSILTNYGAPMTPQNMMRVMQQQGGDSALLGRSMGLQGGNDESGNALDKLAFASQRGPSGSAAMTEPQVDTATSSNRIQANTIPSSMVTTNDIPAQLESTTPPKPFPTSGHLVRQDYRTVDGVDIGTLPYRERGTYLDIGQYKESGINKASDPSFLPWLLAALGIGSTAGRNLMPKDANDAFPRTIEPLTPNTNAVGKPVPETIQNVKGKNLSIGSNGWPKGTEKFAEPSGVTPQNDAVDKIAGATESRRPINTNKYERNSELTNKPTNLESRAVPVDDSIPINNEQVPNLKEIVAKLRRVRK